MELTTQEVRGFVYALELAADDQENYFDTPKPRLDYSAAGQEHIRSKAASFKDCAEAAYRLGQIGLGDRFENLMITALMLADSIDAEITR